MYLMNELMITKKMNYKIHFRNYIITLGFVYLVCKRISFSEMKSKISKAYYILLNKTKFDPSNSDDYGF